MSTGHRSPRRAHAELQTLSDNSAAWIPSTACDRRLAATEPTFDRRMGRAEFNEA